jgi:hypothetical protein
MGDVLPVINAALLSLIVLLLSYLVSYVVKNEHRLTKLEGLPRRVGILESMVFRRRVDESDPFTAPNGK